MFTATPCSNRLKREPLSNRFGEAKIGTTRRAVNAYGEASRNRPVTRMVCGLHLPQGIAESFSHC